MTPREILRETAAMFRQAGIPDPDTDAGLLLEFLTGRAPLALRLDDETELPRETVNAYIKLRDRRLTRVPLQYLTGVQAFGEHEYHVDRRVLIPRPETALLCECAVGLAGSTPEVSVLDLCCGSGCIGIEVSLRVPGARVDLTDLSGEALQMARENAERLHANVRFLQGDLFGAVGGNIYDMILSNPPYIPDEQCLTLQPEVMAEPVMALHGGQDGLDFYRRIASEAPSYLRAGGIVLLETGWDQARRVAEMMINAGFRKIRIHRDLQEIERIVEAVL